MAVVATKTARKAPAKSRAPAKPKAGEGSNSWLKQALAALWARHRIDIVAVGFVLAGLVAACGLWADVAGPLGSGMRTLLGALIGAARVVVPLALVGIGLVLLRGPRPEPADGDEADGPGAKADRSPQADAVRADVVLAVRLAIGTTLTLLSVTGLLHIAVNRPGLADLDGLMAAGGALGVAFGGTLAAVVGVWGAGLVVGAFGLLGMVVLTRVSLRAWARRVDGTKVKAGLHRIGRRFSQAAGSPNGSASPPAATPDHPEQPSTADGDAAQARAAAGGAAHPAPEPEPAPEPKPEAWVAIPPQKPAPEANPPAPKPSPQWRAPAVVGDRPARSSIWKLPSLKLLKGADARQVNGDEAHRKGAALEQALAAHDVGTKLVGMVVGPTVTRYELELAPGVKVSRVTSLSKDIAYALASPDVRILAPIPGRQAIGVEVPNRDRQVVTLGGILASDDARSATHPLEVAIGRDINATPVMMDLSRMPHILIAGATGAGKSSCINSMITSVLMRSTPDQVRMILVDPKMVEMAQYEHVPHLLTQPVTDPKKAANALAWACREMDRRYEVLASVGVRDIDGYNHACDRGAVAADRRRGIGDPEPLERMPLILVVVDELADLMMVAPRDVEDSICRIAQKARAVGIHLVIATQRPSINVITGVIKANIPARLAFAVSSQTDSRVILDQQGAERLVGRGDMLLLSPTSTSAQRIQGAWVTEEEVRNVVAWWRRQAAKMEPAGQGRSVTADGRGNASGDDDPLAPAPSSGADRPGSEDDELLSQAMKLVVESQLGSTSMLQRKLRVGFARAGRLMDLLEQQGVVGPSEGSKAREVLMTPDELS
ncbi:DNA translocase FtsK 4TM domain-containing protein [Candidatus Poriferisocius sp.]|uniref:FtsK/SpoIIIE family DNA translocase n=1 Tax=Candidatus Poriferisocius sp. TaxID=3101276 RepID=UPI003B5A0CA5